MFHWSKDAVFYHIYPLGFCDAPQNNDFNSNPIPRFEKINTLVEHIRNIGCNAVYLGPIFESTKHGYDTVDYYTIDRRLGTNETFKTLVELFHKNSIKVVLDGVFNHVGRDFWAFKDLKYFRENSIYKNWFTNINFGKNSPYNDGFSYDGWNGHYDLVKLDLKNPAVKEHLFNAISMWVNEFGIDGLRLDCADCLSMDFLEELSTFCKKTKPDFWLMGEVIHGDYTKWVNEKRLDSVTNYECYKGLYSSLNDTNYFEIAYSLKRQFGDGGIYKNLGLYSFTDNHDVDRVSSSLKNKKHLFPLYAMLFTIPGVPSIYYGSEFGMEGKKTNGSDYPLRPSFDINNLKGNPLVPDLPEVIKKLIQIRKSNPSLKYGNYKEIFTSQQQFVFLREFEGEKSIVAVNSSENEAKITINIPFSNVQLNDILNEGEIFRVENNRLELNIYPNWGRIMKIA
ncbi:MAG: alpha-amylase [Spirochaetes bacterium GWD1_27_9]|nr:MAG: alpha-amylase [Spirochaetes bacterium GWB1_27_13]OHD27460.1 MAG: alpha-amylase [Spirochaetes bacterium GWC1_27_15]OHD28656.1 MAG: alpha-amylase [Spirochaetes bacterium GWD1_27_9]